VSILSFATTFETPAFMRPTVQVDFAVQWFLSTYDQIANVFSGRQDHDIAAKFRSVSGQSFHDLGQDDQRRPGAREAQWINMTRRLSAGGPPNRSHSNHPGISKKNMTESQITAHGRMNSAIRPAQKMTMMGPVRSRNMAFSGAITAQNCRSSGYQRAA
jgi:hypothetical protein